MIGTVQEIGKTQKGTPWLKIGGEKYYAGGRVDVSQIQVGHKVDIEWKPFGDGDKMKGLQAWAFAPSEAPKSNGAPRPDPNYLDEPAMRFISNCVGNAIASGKCDDPSLITKWAQGAKAALNALHGQHFDGDEKIPF